MTTIPIDSLLVTGFVLALVRSIAWLFVAPPFNTRLVPISVKLGISAALALAAAPHVADPHLSLETGPFLGALLSQAVIGFAMGFVTLMLFAPIQAAGSLIDLFGGYSLAAVFDPTADTSAATFGRLYQLVAVTLLFATNGYLLLFSGFLRSFEVFPASGLSIGRISRVLTSHAGDFLVAALEIAGPVLACLFLAEITLGLLARAAPSLNIFSLAFPVRVVVTIMGVGLALPLVVPALSNLIHAAVRTSLG